MSSSSMIPSLQQLLLSVFLFATSVYAQQVVFEGDGAKRLTEAIASGRGTSARNQIDTDQIIYPWLKPWANAIDIMEQNAKALAFADKVEKERKESLMSPSRSIFDLLKPRKKPEPSTTPKPMLERLFDPIIKPFKTEFDWLTKDLKSFGSTTLPPTTAIPSKDNNIFANLLAIPTSTPKNPVDSKFLAKNATNAHRIEPSTTIAITTTTTTTAVPFLKLLESFGHNQKRREEVEVGRDRTVNVLGMPIGRRDGLSLAPLKGLSLGNEDMFGPIAINDKYNVNWGFFNDLSKMFSKAAQQLTSGTPIVPVSSSVV